jgi:S1-C subfamily serine protease
MGALLLIPAVFSTCLLTPLPASELPRGYLGIRISADLSAKAIHISDVEKGGPAAKAGLKDGDLITHLGGDPVGEVQEFIQTIGDTKPGTKITLKIQRNGKAEEIAVTIGKRPRGN